MENTKMTPDDFHKVEEVVVDLLKELKLDINDPNLKETPHRIAKMYINEIFKGLYVDEPKITIFPNDEKYNQMVILRNVEVKSMCSHHFMPFFGKAHLAYIPGDKICGISKLSRIVDYFARRPQIQENLTSQIANYIQEKMNPKGVIVVIEAQHLCMMMRGVEEPNSKMVTSQFYGAFEEEATRNEFLNLIGRNNG